MYFSIVLFSIHRNINSNAKVKEIIFGVSRDYLHIFISTYLHKYYPMKTFSYSRKQGRRMVGRKMQKDASSTK